MAWTPVLDENGEISRVEVKDDISGERKIYNAKRVPHKTPGFIDSVHLVDQENGSVHALHEFGIDISDITYVEWIAKQELNTTTPSEEELLYEQNLKFGMSEDEALIKAKEKAHGITNAAAKNVVSKENPNLTKVQKQINSSTDYHFKAPAETDDFRVKLISTVTNEMVKFFVSPNIDESRSATYDAITPTHHPGAIQVYKTTNARNFNLNGKMVARTRQEATRNLAYINLIRSWVMPYYGEGTSKNTFTAANIGAPPDILKLTAYGYRNLKDIPVVLTSYSWTYPDNVDYIPTLDGVPFPVMMDMSLMMMEAFSPEQFSNFDLVSYKLGQLDQAFQRGSTINVSKGTTWENKISSSQHYNKNKNRN